MKKSLSILLAVAMVFTMFAGVAFAADKSDGDLLKEAGIILGSDDGTNLDNTNWKREDVTVLLSRLYNKEAEAKATAKGHTYADVTNPFYDGFLTWAKEEGLMHGHSDVEFGYGEEINAQQFATVLLRVIGIDDWENAVAKAVEAGIYAQAIDNEALVSRAQSYTGIVNTLNTEVEDGVTLGAKLELPGFVPEAPAISVAPTGVQKVEVKLSNAVDTDKAKLELKRGSVSVKTSVKWADDKKSAVLTLTDVKLTEADYTVTLTGVQDEAIVASFSAENETVTNIEFVNPSDTVAHSASVKTLVAAYNQYGELASFSGGSYGYFAPTGTVTSLIKNDDGYLELTLKTDGLQTGIGVLPVTIYFNDTRLSVQKTYKVGTVPVVSRVELGEVKYTNSAGALVTTSDKATIPLRQYDQYGDLLTAASGVSTVSTPIVTPYEPKINTPVITDFDKVEVNLNGSVEKSGEYTITVYSGTSSATAKIQVNSSKVATKVEFGTVSGIIAVGDTNKYVPIVAFDAEGNQLTADDIVDNSNRFTITASGATLATGNDIVNGIVQYGEHKGKIKLASVMPQKGTIFMNLGIYTTNVQDSASLNIPVNDARVPETIVLDSANASKAVLGGKSKFKYLVKDQYGETLKAVAVNSGRYEVRITETDNGSGTTVVGQKASAPYKAVYSDTEFADFNEGFEFVTVSGSTGTFKFKAELVRTSDNAILRSVETSIESIPSNTKLTYEVKKVNDLYAALDSSLTPDADKPAKGGNAYDSKFAQTLTITAKDGAGNTVAIPNNRIKDVTTTSTTVVQSVYSGTTYKLIGNKAGTAIVNVIFDKANGESSNAQLDITVKNAAVQVESLSAKATNSIKATAVDTMELKVKDNYGIEYKETDIKKYDTFLGVRYTVSDVKGGGTVTINQATGAISADPSVTEFLLTAVSNNGKTASTLVTQ